MNFRKNISPLLPGIFSLAAAAALLLLSDLTNRREESRQRDKIRVAMIHYGFTADCNDVQTGILERFAEKGLIKDEGLIFDEFNSNGDVATLNEIVKLVSSKDYNLIFTTTLNVTQAVSDKIKKTPVLFTVVANPVGNGLGTSYKDHIPNVTGIDAMSYTDEGIDLIKRYMPDVRRIGQLFVPGEMASVSGLKELERSCREENIELVSAPINSVSDVAEVISILCSKHIDAVCQMPDGYTIPAFSVIIRVTRKLKIPLFCFISSQVKQGAIAAIAGDFTQQGREIADIGFRILDGESPKDIPFSRIKQIRTVINQEAAMAYGLKTPVELMNSSVEVIEN